MNPNILSRLGAISMAVFLAIPSAFAASPVTCKVPFAFQVATKTLPPGEYKFQVDANRQSVVVMASGKNADAMALVVTELAASSHAEATHARIVFDKAGNAYTLSEIWQPGFDGILVATTKEKHEHHVIHIK